LSTTCINPYKKVLVLKPKKVIVKVSFKIYSESGLEPEPESKEIFAEAEPKEIISAPKHCFLLGFILIFQEQYLPGRQVLQVQSQSATDSLDTSG
jgi:hypothetical protein